MKGECVECGAFGELRRVDCCWVSGFCSLCYYEHMSGHEPTWPVPDAEAVGLVEQEES